MGRPLNQRWTPDTCGCQIVMHKDDRDDPNEEFRHVEGTIKAGDGERIEGMVICPAHKGLTRNGVFEAVYRDPDSENKRKNLFIKEVMEDLSLGLCEEVEEPERELHPELGVPVPRLDANGQVITRKRVQFKPNVDVRWKFVDTGDPLHRELEMWVVGAPVTAQMRAKLDAAAARCGTARRPVRVKAQVEIG